MIHKPTVWKSRILGLWMVDPPSNQLYGDTEAFSSWHLALAYALELAGREAQEPPC